MISAICLIMMGKTSVSDRKKELRVTFVPEAEREASNLSSKTRKLIKCVISPTKRKIFMVKM